MEVLFIETGFCIRMHVGPRAGLKQVGAAADGGTVDFSIETEI
jgi:hypothetical protein